MATEQRQYNTEYQSILDISDDMAVNDRVILKGRYKLITDTLQKQALEQLHINHIGMEKKYSLHENQYSGHVFIVILKNI